jgi:D-sedoheptulose 7-phosphate isomerase
VDASISEYFHHLSKVGSDAQATDASGKTIVLDDAVARAVSLAVAAKQRSARVMFIGNGGSAGIASHMATDWLKNGGFAATCFNDGAAITCLANDLGFDQVFAVPIARHARAGDLLFAISSSGKSASILNGVAAARQAGAHVITLSGFKPDNPLRKLGDLNFWLPDGHYGFVEIGHLAVCHAILDMTMGWRRAGDLPVAAAASVSS